MRLAIAGVILCILVALPSASAEAVDASVAIGDACLETSAGGSASVSTRACEAAVTGTIEWARHFLSP